MSHAQIKPIRFTLKTLWASAFCLSAGLFLFAFAPLIHSPRFILSVLVCLGLFTGSSYLAKVLDLKSKLMARAVVALNILVTFLLPNAAFGQVTVTGSNACQGGGILADVNAWVVNQFAGIVLGTAGNLSDNFCQIMGMILLITFVSMMAAAGYGIFQHNRNGQSWGEALTPFVSLVIFGAIVGVGSAIFFGGTA